MFLYEKAFLSELQMLNFILFKVRVSMMVIFHCHTLSHVTWYSYILQKNVKGFSIMTLYNISWS